MGLNRAALALALTAALAGCVPFPHFEAVTPRIDGRVTRAGSSVAGARVSLYSNLSPRADCAAAQPLVSTVTGASGQFHFERQRDFEFFMAMGDRLTEWALCIESEGVTEKGVNTMAGAAMQPGVPLDCDLDRAASAGPGRVEVCRR